MRKLLLAFILFYGSVSPALADTDPVEPAMDPDPAPPRRGSTNITVDSSDLNPFALNEEDRQKKEDRFSFYRDEAVNIDINENGDPNLNTRF